ncbi:hypothetical protein ACJMK2_023482, partial [Sinanodonta woodiana]
YEYTTTGPITWTISSVSSQREYTITYTKLSEIFAGMRRVFQTHLQRLRDLFQHELTGHKTGAIITR